MHQALELPSNDRAALVEGLIASLDQPNPALDAMWLKEAEDRLAAYHAVSLVRSMQNESSRILVERFEDQTSASRA